MRTAQGWDSRRDRTQLVGPLQGLSSPEAGCHVSVCANFLIEQELILTHNIQVGTNTAAVSTQVLSTLWTLSGQSNHSVEAEQHIHGIIYNCSRASNLLWDDTLVKGTKIAVSRAFYTST
jgi:hypothetical protein